LGHHETPHNTTGQSALIQEVLKELTESTKTVVQELEGLLLDMAASGDLDQYSGSLTAACDRLQATVGVSPGIIVRKITIGSAAAPAMIAFLDGQIDDDILNRDTLMLSELAGPSVPDSASLLTTLKEHVLAVGNLKTASKWSDIIPSIMLGMTMLAIDGVAEVILLDTTKFPSRSVSRSHSEPSIKGPQEAFTEVLLTQMDQLRRRLPAESLRMEPFTIGTDTHTKVLLVYMDSVVNPGIVQSIRERLSGIQRASVQAANEVGEYLSDRRLTIFPQVRFSDRVDLIARNLDQGKVAILTANDPTAMLLPNTLMDFYQTTQDYSTPFWDGTLMRVIRLAGLIIGLYLMPTYIALTSANPDLLPIKLLLTIDGARQGIPFPPVVEVIIMWLIIEILREAANRLPQQLATTIGTVGAVVVGTAIVKAGIVDSLMIIIVTLTALGLFTVPAIEIAATWRWMFWIFVVAAWLFGVYGLLLITVVLIIHLTSLENFGVPYLSPFGPIRLADLSDSWIRFPFPQLLRRPVSLRTLIPHQAEPDLIQPRVNLHESQSRMRT
jgi:hypothetical protein